VAALLEQRLGMSFLKIIGSDLCQGNMRRDAEHGHTRAMTIEQTVDEMQVAGSAASCADRELSRQMRLGAGREGRDLLVPHMDPFDLALAPNCVRQPIQAISDDTVNPFDPRCGEDFRELKCHRCGHAISTQRSNVCRHGVRAASGSHTSASRHLLIAADESFLSALAVFEPRLL